MMTMNRLDTTNGKTSLRHAAAVAKPRVTRDLANDWKRWSLAERVIAAAIVPVMVLTVLAMSTALAHGGH
jgi:hypothetical protein